jgi:hypothetical protein
MTQQFQSAGVLSVPVGAKRFLAFFDAQWQGGGRLEWDAHSLAQRTLQIDNAALEKADQVAYQQAKDSTMPAWGRIWMWAQYSCRAAAGSDQ